MPIKDLPVISRGSFFDDSFFNESWAEFDRAIQGVVGGFDRDPKMSQYSSPSQPQTSQNETRDSYRQLRQGEGDLYATQAVQVTEKDGKFQAVIDVKDFNPRDLQVKVIDERVVLEGRYDVVSPDGKNSTSKAFYREFTLPPEADIDQVSTALSKDGVLTVKAPRKEGIPLSPVTQEPRYNDPKLDHIKNIRNFIQNSSGFESHDATDSLPKDLKDRLLLSDRDSGRWSGSGSPSCVSPTPSDAGSEASKVSSSMDFDLGKRAPFSRSEVSFKVKAPENDASSASSTYSSRVGTPQSSHLGSNPPGMPLGSTSSISSLGSSSTIHEDDFRNTPTPSQTPQPTMSWPPITNQYQNVVPAYQPQRPAMARSSGGTATISVKEEDGKRIQTSETSSVVQEKDGFLESKEIASEITGKEAQGARREAQTRMMKEEQDPFGRGKKSEKADASDLSESSVERRPDGSIVTTKKSSTSSSNFKQSFSTDSAEMPPSLFDSDFGDIRSLMGRGHSLMSQMPGDSSFPEMGNMSSRMNAAFPSRLSDMSNFNDFPEMQSPFADRFTDRSSLFSRQPDFPSRSGFSSNFPSNFTSNISNQTNTQQQNTTPQGNSNTKNSTQSSSQSSFSNSIFDNRKF